MLAGNKIADGAIVPAGGVREEVAIARGQHKPVIPIGATGHVALELWNECKADPSRFVGDADVAASLAVLGDATAKVSALVKAVLDVLKHLDK